MNKYIPENRYEPKIINVSSAWGDIPTIIQDIINRFNIKQNSCLEFGVEYGLSTSALANYFKIVIFSLSHLTVFFFQNIFYN